MANTKQISDRNERKAKKREQRKALKAAYYELSKADKRRYKKSETVGLRKWIAEAEASE